MRILFTIIFVFLTLLSLIIFDYISTKTKEYHLNQKTMTYERAYNTIYDQYKDLSYVIYTGLLKLTNIQNEFKYMKNKTYKEKVQIKKELYLQVINRFNTLRNKKLINITFILPNSEIFLDMKQPFKKTMNENKRAFNFVKNNKENMDSFEVKDEDTGFNFLYSIKSENDVVGFLNITFSEQAITSSLMEQYYVLTNFIIKNDNFSKKYLENTEQYKDAHFKGFSHNTNILAELKEVSRKDIMSLKPEKKISKQIYNDAMKNEANSIFINNDNIIVTTIPVMNKLTNRQEAFLAVLSKENGLSNLEKTYRLILLLFIFLYLSILLALYFLISRSIAEKNSLNKIIKKDKQLLEQMKLAQMGEMIGNIAHQWRQPLSTISTAASGLKMKHEFGMLEENDIPEFTDTIVTNTKYLSETIDTFRDFIKEEKETKEIVIQERIDETLKIVRASLENSYIKLINNIDYEKPLKVEIVAEELAQVLINILNNAKDVIIQRKIEEGTITIDLIQGNKNFKITVEDNAKGIEEDVLPKIFDPYFTTKHQFHGTGLGLYMSKLIVEKHLFGRLEAENTNEGAKFIITIPLS
ncbi:sensor histidine kinase [Arcobacter sp. CECT 8983]|uniref:sensor histidine kinase n=1 Tax=Arcobacter sp. CECT 8983 TaxID=2044508 RepID=UPI00100BF9AC|nr:HAMP domain-containing sensor histidine kinase [Arcobacter sp. CECT 8983]